MSIPTTKLSPLKILGVLLFLVGGCSQPLVKTQLVTLKAAPAANNNQPIAVDLVLVYDPALLPLFSTLTTREWFEKRTQFQEHYRSRLTVLPKEVPPNAIESFDVENNNAQGVLLFVDYHTPDNRFSQRLDTMKRVTVCLEKHQFLVLDTAKTDCHPSSVATTINGATFQKDLLDRFVIGRDKTSQAIRTVYLQANEMLHFFMFPRTSQTVTVRLLSDDWVEKEQHIFPIDDKVKAELKNQRRYLEQQQDREKPKAQPLQTAIQQWSCQRLQQGMTEAEVVKVLGQPWQYGPALPEAGSFFLVSEQITLLFKNSRLYQVLGGNLGCR